MAEPYAPLARLGQPAPDFEAIAYAQGEFKTIKLSDYRGQWVILFFYPADFTFVCPTELTQVALKYQELQDLGVAFFSVSTDTHFTHKAWQDHELSKLVAGGLPYPMLSDANGHIGRLYGVYDEASGLDNRGRFIIDPDGIVVGIELTQAGVGRSVAELLRQIKACQYVRGTGEATPSGWEPGKATLKPGRDLVGKVCDFWTPDQ
jgi:peroxiredoxin (alkyl hydroperoxide reductase subunit C)